MVVDEPIDRTLPPGSGSLQSFRVRPLDTDRRAEVGLRHTCRRPDVVSWRYGWSDRYRVAATARRTASIERSTSFSVVNPFDTETRSRR